MDEIHLQQTDTGWSAIGTGAYAAGKTEGHAVANLIGQMIVRGYWPPISAKDWMTMRPAYTPPKAVAQDWPDFSDDNERIRTLMEQENAVYVFGSNHLGLHKFDYAKEAFDKYGAVQGKPEGHAGKSFAVIVEDGPGKSSPIESIKTRVGRMLKYAEAHSELLFVITPLAITRKSIHKVEDIAPLFKDAPANCSLPVGWK